MPIRNDINKSLSKFKPAYLLIGLLLLNSNNCNFDPSTIGLDGLSSRETRISLTPPRSSTVGKSATIYVEMYNVTNPIIEDIKVCKSGSDINYSAAFNLDQYKQTPLKKSITFTPSTAIKPGPYRCTVTITCGDRQQKIIEAFVLAIEESMGQKWERHDQAKETIAKESKKRQKKFWEKWKQK